MGNLKSIVQALNEGYKIGCWMSGGRELIVAIMDKDNQTIAAGSGYNFEKCFDDAAKEWNKFKKKQKLKVSKSTVVIDEALNLIEDWIKRGRSAYITFESLKDLYFVILDGYDNNVDPIFKIEYGKDPFETVIAAFDAPSRLKSKM